MKAAGKVELLTGNVQTEWDKYVDRHLKGTYYHLSGWKTVVEQAYRLPGYYFYYRRPNGNIAGVFPSFHVKHFLFGNSLVSMPYLDGGGVLADDPPVYQALLKSATEFAVDRQIPHVELRYLNSGAGSLAGQSMIPASEPHKVRMVLPLPENSEALFKSFKPKLRSQIRKPTKENLKFVLGGPEKISDFYQVFTVNMRDLGSPVHSFIFFKLLVSVLQRYCKIGVVYHEARPIGAGIIFEFHETVSIPWASTLRAFNHLSPNMLLYWRFLQYAADAGYNFFDFGRSTLNSGTYRFKEQWGANPHQLYWEYLSIMKQPRASTDANRFSFFIKCWQKMPVGMTRIFGPRLRKYITL